MKEVEVIKLGEIIGRLSGEGALKPVVMTITDGGEIVDYYLDIFLRNMKDELKENGVRIQRTAGGIVSATPHFGDILRGKVPTGKGRKGIEDGEPIVGESYTLDNNSWHTSRVDRVIENCVLVTKNSIYAIHTLQNIRNRKLDDLGI